MHRHRLTRALIALVAPVLAIPAIASSATAASYPDVPSVDAVAKIYPHLEGGTASESTSKVYGPGKKCKPGKAIKGAGARTASYAAAFDPDDPTAFEMTGDRPGVYAAAMRFPNAKAAITYLHGYDKVATQCPGGGPGGNPGGPDVHVTMKKIKFSLGDERWGYQMTMRSDDLTMITNTLFVRDGKFIVYTGGTSMDGTAPSIPKSIALTKLALKSVG